MENTVLGGSIIDLEHPIHLRPTSVIPQPYGADHPTPFSLFDPSPVKQRITSDDEDDPSCYVVDEAGPRGKKTGPSSSPWQRMKWTDNMVRLLITVVSSVGDDGPLESPEGPAGAKRKLGACALQKKGKWKTVSKIMLEKGCYVSPQQCEDKFNDLNKRYKKLNDMLGRGTTCQVVENPTLLDSMVHISPKAKDDVRKLLASKHLFYREMCAYHNGQRIPHSHEAGPQSCGVEVASLKQTDERANEVDCAEEEADYDDDGEDEDVGNMSTEGCEFRNIDFTRSNCQSLREQMDAAFREGAMSAVEMKEWLRKRAMQLEEERVEIVLEAFELQKQRFKWQRFCRKKDREIERMRLENERMGLENERMALEVKNKEMELEMRGAVGLGEDDCYVVGTTSFDHQYG